MEPQTRSLLRRLPGRRLPKYRRTAESFVALSHRRITDRSLAIISYLSGYNFLPSSLLVRLVEGNRDITYRHLQMLYHRKLVNRFSFVNALNPGEFHYYLDNTAALDLLVDEDWAEPNDLDYDGARRNREKNYSAIHEQVDELQGRLLFLKHEADISRFHAMLELGCRQSGGKIDLADWRQGPELWRSVVVPKVKFDNQTDLWGEQKDAEKLPHRPDGFFTLRFADRPEGEREAHFFYERDRKTTTDRKRIVRKLRSHFHYVVKQRQHEADYGIKRVRAVLVETVDDDWAMHLREVSAHPLVSGRQASPLFWFTTSRLFEFGPNKDEVERYAKRKDFFLSHPEIIFHPLWATPVDNSLYSLLD